MGMDLLREAYAEAIRERYRFYSSAMRCSFYDGSPMADTLPQKNVTHTGMKV